MAEKLFATEADLCMAFCAAVTAGGEWDVFAETAGFDILLAHKTADWQIGIEAKLSLNAKVLEQILPSNWYRQQIGPDFRAVLVPDGKAGGLSPICDALGITVITCRPFAEGDSRAIRYASLPYQPKLPDPKHQWHSDFSGSHWHEWAPDQRCSLPEYRPDVIPGRPAPRMLSEWKIKAIKIAILLETRPVFRADFDHLRLSPTRWTDKWCGWLSKASAGGWVAGADMPDFKGQHPEPYEQIKADIEKWKPKHKDAA